MGARSKIWEAPWMMNLVAEMNFATPSVVRNERLQKWLPSWKKPRLLQIKLREAKNLPLLKSRKFLIEQPNCIQCTTICRAQNARLRETSTLSRKRSKNWNLRRVRPKIERTRQDQRSLASWQTWQPLKRRYPWLTRAST